MTVRGFFTAQEGQDSVSLPMSKDGKPCPYVVLDGPKAKRLAGLGLIEADLEFCYAGVELMLEMDLKEKVNRDHFIVRSALFSTVVTYGKAFTSAEGRKVHLDANSVFKEHPSLAKSHREIMDLRHNYIAHSGMGSYEFAKVLLILNPDESDRRPLTIHGLEIGVSGQKRDTLWEYRAVFAHVLKEVKQMQKKITSAMKAEILAEPIERWYERAEKP